MNRRKVKRDLRKELLCLQAVQHRQALAREWHRIVPGELGLVASESALLSGAQWLLAALPQGRWRKWLVFGLALGRMALAFSRKSQHP